MPAHPGEEISHCLKAHASTGSSTTKPAHRGGSWGWGGEDRATAGGTNEGTVSDPSHRLVPGRLLGTLQTPSLDGMGLGVKVGVTDSHDRLVPPDECCHCLASGPHHSGLRSIFSQMSSVLEKAQAS